MAVDARRWLVVGATALVSTVVWFVVRDELSGVVGALARALVGLAGYETYDGRADALAIVIARPPDGAALVRGTTLERWHVNLIALPILVVALGPVAWRRRLGLVTVGAALVLVCDALSAIGFVGLQGWGASGSGDPTMRHMAMRGLAVYGSKLVPVVVFACTARRRTVEGT